MRLRNTLLTGGASYIQLVTLMVTQLVSIPLALRFLSHEQFGLWSFTSQSLGYLLLLDLGVTNSVGRLMAEPLYNDPHEEHWNGWYNLFLIILVAQATLILVLGWLLVEPILHWFRIPPALHAEARALWIMMLCINVVAFPFRVYPGLLGAQNRSYWSTLSSTLSMWVGLVAFYLFLKLGFNGGRYSA
jgi:O-antigen/teichoic acid export membrane protein